MELGNLTDHLETQFIPVSVKYLNIFIGLAAVVLNLLVIYAYCIDREIRYVPANFFILSLSISDEMTGISLLVLFAWIQNGAILPSNNNIPCLVWGILTYMCLLFSAFVVILISWDRLQMVTYPIQYHQFTRRRAVLQVAVLGICVFVYSFAILFVLELVKVFFNEERLSSPCIISSFDDSSVYVSVVFDGAIPFTILLMINGLIVVRFGRVTGVWIERQRVAVNVVDKPPPSDVVDSIEMETSSSFVGTKTLESESKINSDQAAKRPSNISRQVYSKIRKTVCVLFILEIVYVSCWLPLYVGMITESVVGVSDWVLHLLYMIGGLNSAINPFIYAFMCNKYRKRLKLMLRCRHR